ncbi:UNVERIFIED_CONTAM: hypothetical protein HDU68_000956 [Siphonaria sp. JEL0065]|nr:hypothetical protein HDU68_000956 [Siphonaria sp. JEL0065]
MTSKPHHRHSRGMPTAKLMSHHSITKTNPSGCEYSLDSLCCSLATFKLPVASSFSPFDDKIPTELVHRIFAYVHPAEVSKYKSLSKSFNICLSDPHFATLNFANYVNLQMPLKCGETPNEFDRLWFQLSHEHQQVYASRFRELSSLRWYKNHLDGYIRPISLLTTIVTLDLSCNNLNNEIPVDIGNLKCLEVLNLGVNSISGEIPMQIGGLVALRILNISGNRLHGQIPWSIGELTQLTHLDLNNNCLTGLIPSQLGQLLNLESLLLSANLLTGWIPTELTDLVHLSHLDLGSNLLCGPLPCAIGKLQSLRFLLTNNNSLTGVIPESIGLLHNLEYMDMKNNQLSDPVPVCLQYLQHLAYLDLSDNFIGKADILMERVEATWENEVFSDDDIL